MATEKRQALFDAVLGADQQMRAIGLLALQVIVYSERAPDDLAHAVGMNLVANQFELFLDLNRHVQIESGTLGCFRAERISLPITDGLVTGQVVRHNPAASVRGPSHTKKKGKTPVLDATEAR